MSDHWRYALDLRTRTIFRVKDVDFVLVDDVEALGAVQILGHFRNCFLVLDDLSSVGRVEDCRRFRVCTLHR